MIMKYKILFLGCWLAVTSVISVDAQRDYVKTGMASFYADKFEGKQTASGEIYYHAKKTAAHNSLAFGSVVKVTNLENNKYVVVRINDRGPFVENRIIDLSKSAARELGFVAAGLAKVKIELIASTDDFNDKIPLLKEDKNPAEYYKLDVDQVSLSGKGIQVGSYKHDENIFRLASELKKKFKEEIFIEIANVKKQKVYRIIVGNYNSDIPLYALKTEIAKIYPECFIVSFKN